MSKVLSSWSGMRKYLEEEMLADSLKGRIRYGCTSYAGMDGKCIFEICIDGKQFKRFSWETVNSYFIDKGFKNVKKPMSTAEYWSGEFFDLLKKYPLTERTEYTDEEFCDALKEYRNQEISESINSINPLIRMFAVLDRRVGKRTLVNLKATPDNQPQWLWDLCVLRLLAEGV